MHTLRLAGRLEGLELALQCNNLVVSLGNVMVAHLVLLLRDNALVLLNLTLNTRATCQRESYTGQEMDRGNGAQQLQAKRRAA